MENVRKPEEFIGLIQLLNSWKRDGKIGFTTLRDALSNMLHAEIDGLKKFESIGLTNIDDVLFFSRNILTINEEIFRDFIEYRDLAKKMVNDLRVSIEATKSLIETLDKLIYWSNKRYTQ